MTDPTKALSAEQMADRIDSLENQLGALKTEIIEAAYRAWPEAEDCGWDAGNIIDQLAAEKRTLEAELEKARALMFDALRHLESSAADYHYLTPAPFLQQLRAAAAGEREGGDG